MYVYSGLTCALEEDEASPDEEDHLDHDEGKRGEILTAAGMVFGQYGLRKTTMGDLLREAGVARATLYKYFSSKEEVFRAVVEREVEDILGAVRGAVAEAGTTRGELRAAVMTYTDMITHKVNIYRVTLKTLSDIMPMRSEHVQKMARQLQNVFRGILADGVADGGIVVEDVDLTALTLVYALKGIFMSAATDTWLESREVVVDRLLDLVLDGMRPRRESV